MKHHVHCAHADKNHRGVCRDSQGEALTHLGTSKPITDERLVALPAVGTPQSQYEDLEFNEEPVGQVLEGEVWKGTFMPHARPDGPRVEMTISDEKGISITVAAEVSAEMRHLYDWDMLTSDVTSHARRLYEGIESAERA